MKVCPKCDHGNPEENSFCEECGTQLSSENSDGVDAFVGEVISGKYKIEALIGQGAMGRVYRAIQEPIQRPVAIKILHQHLVKDRRVSKRFAREAQAASRFNHPNSIGIIDLGNTESGSLFIAMEYIKGCDLSDIISKEAPLDPERVVRIGTQVLSALQLAHSSNIIHRDLKPENIMLEEIPGHSDFVKVCDFGIAKIQQPPGADQESALTMFGMICGTPYYMSPEQAKGEELDGRSDLYSMGVILYEMLTGEVPFRGATPVEVIARHLTDPPEPPSKFRPDIEIPRALEKVVMCALTKKKDERYENAAKMAEALEQALKDAEEQAYQEAAFKADLQQILHDAEASPVVVGTPISQPTSPSQQYDTPLPNSRGFGSIKAASPASSSDAGFDVAVQEKTDPFVLAQEDSRSRIDTPHDEHFVPDLPGANPEFEDMEFKSQNKGKLITLILGLLIGLVGAAILIVPRFFDKPKASKKVKAPPKVRKVYTRPRPPKRRVQVRPTKTRMGAVGQAPRRGTPVPPRVRRPKPRRDNARRIMIRRRRQRERRVARLAALAVEKKKYRKQLRQFNTWVRRYRVDTADFPSATRSHLFRMRAASRKKQYRKAHQKIMLLRRDLGQFRGLTKVIVKNKISRFYRKYKALRKSGAISAFNLAMVRSLFSSAQMAFMQGALNKSNTKLNRGFTLMRQKK